MLLKWIEVDWIGLSITAQAAEVYWSDLCFECRLFLVRISVKAVLSHSELTRRHSFVIL